MAHFALINKDRMVVDVIVASQKFIDSGIKGDPLNWIQTSYNTFGGVHKLGGTPLRKNFAGIGYYHDIENDAFYSPKPFSSWVLNKETFLWDAPIPMPGDGGLYNWDEGSLSWILI